MDTYKTISVRGVGFAPEKQEYLVLPAEVTTHAELNDFLSKSTLKQVGAVALESLKD